MAVNTNNINEIRVGVLGYSVDESASGGLAGSGQWISTGPAASRTTLNPLSSGERILTRILNAIDAQASLLQGAVQDFDARFNEVVGNEKGVDQTAFDALGKNLIQAIFAGGGVTVYSDDFTGTEWIVNHNLNHRYVSVTVVNSSGNTVIGDIEYTDDDSCKITFAKSVNGTVSVRR